MITQNLILILLLLSGTFTQISLIRSNAFDALWHISLIENAFRTLPPTNPLYSGVLLSGYHYLYDFLIFIVHKATHLDSFVLYLYIFPSLVGVFYGYTTYLLAKRVTNSYYFALLAVFLSYFSGSFAYLAGLFFPVKVWSESLLWSMQPVSFLINQQLELSLSIISLILYLFLSVKFQKTSVKILIGLILGLLVGIKSYGAVLVFISLIPLAILNFLEWRSMFIVFIVSVAVSLYVVSLTGASASNFIWTPGWFIKNIMEAPDRLNNINWELARQTYVAESNTKRVVWLYVIGFFVFVAGNLGVRIIGFINIFQAQNSKNKKIEVFLTSLAILGILFPMLFLQKGVAWNTIQFFYYSIFSTNLLLVIFLANTYKARKIQAILLIFILLVLTLPTTIKSIQENSRPFNHPLVDQRSYRAYSFLAKKEYGLVLSTYVETPEISAYTSKPMYFSSKPQSDLLLLSSKTKLEYLDNYFCTENKIDSVGALYVYIDHKKLPAGCELRKSINGKLIYDRNNIQIYHVNKDENSQ